MRNKPLFLLLAAIVVFTIFPTAHVFALDPGEPAGKCWVLKEIKFGHPDKYDIIESSWGDIKTTYETTFKETSISIRERYIAKSPPNQILYEHLIEFNFDKPTNTLVPADKVTLNLNSKMEGKLRPSAVRRNLGLKAEVWTTSNKLDKSINSKIVTVEANSLKDTEVLLFIVPVISDGKFVITGYSDVRPEYFVSWIYEPGAFASDSNRDRIMPPRTWIEDIPNHISISQPGVMIRGKDDTDWKPAIDAMIIRKGDTIRTAFGGKAHVIYTDADGGDACLTIGSETEINIDHLTTVEQEGLPSLISSITGKKKSALISLIRGTMRWITKGWRNDSIFSIKAGTTIHGIRGCDVIVKYMPNYDGLQIFVREGAATLTNSKTIITKELNSGQWISAMSGKFDEIQKLDEDAWETTLRASKMEVDKTILTQKDTSFSALTIGIIITIIIIGVIAIAVALFFGIRMLRKKS